MKTIIISALALATFVIAGAASAKDKKPVVCENWLPYVTARTDVKDAPKIWVCFDKEDKPFAMFDVHFVEQVKDGNTIRWAVGYK